MSTADDTAREAMIAVYAWIEERHGAAIAASWLWGMTPYPCGFASAEQLDAGMRMALGTAADAAHMLAASERETDTAMAGQ